MSIEDTARLTEPQQPLRVIRKIPAFATATAILNRLINEAAYARVSTDSEEHHDSQHAPKREIHHQKNRSECKMKPIKEQAVEEAFVATLNSLVADRQRIMRNLEQTARAIIAQTPIKSVAELQRQIQAVDRQTVEVSNRRPVTAEDQALTAKLTDQAKQLREEITIAERMKGTHDLLNERVKEISKVIRLPYFEYHGDIFRSLVEKVIVKDKKTLRFIFKCGIELDHQTA